MHEVTDMYFVAALIAYGADYDWVDKADKRNQKFLFKEPIGIQQIHTFRKGRTDTVDNPTFEQVKHAFDTVTLLFPPSYSETLRRVKGIIHT